MLISSDDVKWHRNMQFHLAVDNLSSSLDQRGSPSRSLYIHCVQFPPTSSGRVQICPLALRREQLHQALWKKGVGGPRLKIGRVIMNYEHRGADYCMDDKKNVCIDTA